MSENLQKYRFIGAILPQSHEKRLVLLTGARQTGKTTLAKKNYPDLKYINLDSREIRESIRGISSLSWGKDVGKSILDEAQKEPTVFEKVKYAYDERDRSGLSFTLLLGSSQILLLKKIRESLAGRISIYELYPLMMSELYWDMESPAVKPPLVDRLFSGQAFDQIFKNLPSVLLGEEDELRRNAENHLLLWGGMPALLPLTGEERWKWIKDYELTYLERDLGDLARLDDLEPFRKFQKLSAWRTGRLLNYSELARDASISVDTARRYLEYLKISYQVLLLQPYYRNITSSVVKTPKLYWLDIGLLRQLSGFRGETSGEIYETMVTAELAKWIKTMQKNAELYFYRTRSGMEVDLLLQTEQGFIGIEAKARKRIGSPDFRSLKEVAAGLKKEWRGGLVVYLGDRIEKVAKPEIWAVPSRRLLI